MPSWATYVRGYFETREELAWPDLLVEFGVHDAALLPLVEECLGVFYENYRIRAGWLRADDSFSIFATFVSQGSWYTWPWRRAAYEYSSVDVLDQLAIRRQKIGREAKVLPANLKMYVELWLGQH